ncbi:aldose 1-epimerase [Leuconostoc kimchii IMSNU 11154]|uniref:Aldose 1-epimerase n=1 Tax=Leuconostoc kimchii (strain IMSNU 11154 / KCTC 2386 / IH25) TaxID=762051 RepID=D5T089_LEUKI|nr:aldose epimerase family protein [Leuconostoc kimchii]ADG39688.1 aldose 1-epimerase [Leuconostoc kimchii IMSNU 11154]
MIKVIDFGKHRGQMVQRYTLENVHGTRLSVLNFAGIIQEFSVYENETRVNLVLSSDDFASLTADYNINRIIGRTAGRIADGRWTQNERNIVVPTNENGHTLHGGPQGLSEQFFDVSINQEANEITLKRQQLSELDGFPGDINVQVTYQLTDDNRVILKFTGEQLKADGVFNPTIHSYFNLANPGVDNLLTHELWLNSQKHAAINADKIPTGSLLDNANTLFDFKNETNLGVILPKLRSKIKEGGLDDAFLVEPSLVKPVVVLTENNSGRRLSVYSDRNAVVAFTANQLDNDVIKDTNRGEGHPWIAVALEAQTLPNSENIPTFGHVDLAVNDTAEATIIYAYDTLK